MVSYGIVRLGIYITIAFFSLIVLGLGGHLIYGLAIATSVLTLLSILPVLIVDHFRRGTFLVWTAVELGWLFVLNWMWVATGGYAASLASWCGGAEYDYYGSVYYYGFSAGYCNELRAIAAFAFLNWFMMLGMFIYIVVMAVRAHNSGYTGIWQDSLGEYKTNPNIGTAGPGMTYTQPTPMMTRPGEQMQPGAMA